MKDVLKSIVGIRGRDKLADLRVFARLHAEHSMADWYTETSDVLRAIGIPLPPPGAKQWHRLNRYVWDLRGATPGLMLFLLEETNV